MGVKAPFICSLCRKNVSRGSELDEGDLVFSTYRKARALVGFAKFQGKHLAICKECLPEYKRMRKEYDTKKLSLGIMAVIVAIANFALTANAVFSLIIGLFVFSLSIFSYCPPLKET